MRKSSLLWLLHPPEGQPCWLFGSMHIQDKRVYQWCEKLYPIIENANVYVGEMDLSNPGISEDQPQYNLKQYIKPRVFEKVRAHILKSFMVDIGPLMHLHPLMLMSLITQTVLEREQQVSLDEHLWDYAKLKGIKTIGLESYGEQFRILHEIPPEPMLKQLVKMAKSSSGIRKQTQRALSWYMMSDLQRLYRITKSSMHGLRRRIIYDRNSVMAHRIHTFDHDNKYFVVVGAGHLSGKFGILALLKHRGWKVQPVSLD